MAYGVNFINILLAAFTGADPKSAYKYSQAINLFALLGSARVKALCKMMVNSTPEVAAYFTYIKEISKRH